MKAVSGRRGFSVVELLVAVALFGVVLSAAFGIQAAVLRQQTLGLGTLLVDNTATLIGQALRHACMTASVIGSPGPGGPSSALLLGHNVNPEDGSRLSPDPSVGQRFSYFCLDSTSSLFLYEGPWPLPAIKCGATVGGAVSRTLLGGSQDGTVKVVTLEFTRPPGEQNALDIHYQVDMAKTATRLRFSAEHRTRMVIRNGMGRT